MKPQMGKRGYWLDLFTGQRWEEFKKAGTNVSGFRISRRKVVQQIKTGDCLLCYLTGVSRFIGVLEVLEEAFEDTAPIWSDEQFPCRLRVKPVIELGFDTAVPVAELKERLSFFQNMKSSTAWTGRFRGSPTKWKDSEGSTRSLQAVKALRGVLGAHRPFSSRFFLSSPAEHDRVSGESACQGAARILIEGLASVFFPYRASCSQRSSRFLSSSPPCNRSR